MTKTPPPSNLPPPTVHTPQPITHPDVNGLKAAQKIVDALQKLGLPKAPPPDQGQVKKLTTAPTQSFSPLFDTAAAPANATPSCLSAEQFVFNSMLFSGGLI